MHVNPFFLDTLLTPLVGLADDDDSVSAYGEIDLDDKSQAARIAQEVLVPFFRSLGPEVRKNIDNTYRYYLTKSDTKWHRVYDSALLPFRAPKDPRSFFLIAYQECFGTTFSALDDIGNVEVRADANQTFAAWEKDRLDGYARGEDSQ